VGVGIGVGVGGGRVRRGMEEELAMLRQFIGQLQDLLNLYGSPLPPFDSLQPFHFHNQQQQNHNNGNNNRSLFRSLSFLDSYFFLSTRFVFTVTSHFLLIFKFHFICYLGFLLPFYFLCFKVTLLLIVFIIRFFLSNFMCCEFGKLK